MFEVMKSVTGKEQEKDFSFAVRFPELAQQREEHDLSLSYGYSLLLYTLSKLPFQPSSSEGGMQ